MKKIPTLFARNTRDRRHVLDQVVAGCEWVLNGEGIALRKYDGTCVMKDKDGAWWARRTLKPYAGDYLKTPPGYREEEFNHVTGESVGWVPMEHSQFAAIHAYALDASPTPHAGTYELCGPTINGNPEGFDWPGLVLHTHAQKIPELTLLPLKFPFIREFLGSDTFTFEGVVWHHKSGDGRMAKLKKRDFPRPA